ncbi:MAG: DUF438 domain-containing protein [Gemmatimonadetes bacterium]|nr:DUF438 domain-containing protein [Gemmatimonadota bacterium]
MVQISPDTSIHELLEKYPFLGDFLADYNPKFSLLKNPMMRATAGRIATIRKASQMGGVELGDLLDAIRREVERASADRDGSREDASEVGDLNKVAELKHLILDLHEGVEPEEAKARFNTVVKDVSPEEIGAMEEQLIREGMPVEEIQRLCDLHVAVVQDALDTHDEVIAPPGHPIHTYQAENEIITTLANRLGELCTDERRDGFSGPGWSADYLEVIGNLAGIDNHYLRKENELFPALERHGISGPSQVMLGVHDEIRGQVREAREYLEAGSWEGAARAGASLARAVVEMVYKEEKILLPLAHRTLTHGEWADVRKGEDELGYDFHTPSEPFPEAQSEVEAPQPRPGPPDPGLQLPIVSAAPSAPLPEVTDQAFVDLGTGRLSIQQLDMMLRNLPIEISFVDADGFVRYYSETEERLFPRTPGAIGRHVENCHPPKSIHMVKEILEKFASGDRDVAEFWIEMQGKFIHIRYFAVRSLEREYLGCLEVTQDVTEIRALEGQRRLLEWQ